MKSFLKVLLLIVCGLSLYFLLIDRSSRIPYSYFDEFWLVNDSYLAEYYFDGDWKNKVWDSEDAKQQPMLSRQAIYLTLYPGYLKEKRMITDKKESEDFTYSKYLISSGFIYSTTNNDINKEFLDNKSYDFRKIDSSDVGSVDYLTDKYGGWIAKPVKLIDTYRRVNVVFIVLALLILILTLYKNKTLIFGFTVVLLIANHKLFLDTTLKAHSEALMFLLFTFCLYFLGKVSEKASTLNILYTSIFIGLLVSIKLNGIFLYPVIFILIMLSELAKFSRKNLIKFLGKIIFSFVVILTVFMILNPEVLKSPVIGILEMYKIRSNIVTSQMLYWTSFALHGPIDRFLAIYEKLIKQNFPFLGHLNGLFILLGLFLELRWLFRNISYSRVIVISFGILLISMIFYLKINWDRYYIPLVFYTIYFEVCGISYLLVNLRKRFYK